MKRKDSRIFSSKRCICGCGRFIKQNLIDRNPDALFIYRHYPQSKKNRTGANRRPAMQMIEGMRLGVMSKGNNIKSMTENLK